MIVTAVLSPLLAKPGNKKEVAIKASVTTTAGQPVVGLGSATVKVSTTIVGPGGSNVDVTRVVEDIPPLRGFYLIEVVPIPAGTWKAGTYLFQIAVTRGNQHGQTVASLVIA